MKLKFIHILLAAGLFITNSIVSQAASMYKFSSSPIRFGESNVTVGFQFTANKNLKVSSLGFYDYKKDGLKSDHLVGIFNTKGKLLRSVSVLSGTSSILDGKFRYASIPSIKLSSGKTYIIAGLATADDGYTYGNIGSSIKGFKARTDVTISPLASRFIYGPFLTNPTQFYRYDLYLMVNMKYDSLLGKSNISSVPVPAALPLLTMSLAGLAGLKRRYFLQTKSKEI